ncbi:hypothetical protein BaRGS_00011959 [Batillaria attramentaria]|uniref:VWFA domain-containing protein n=1 Tax=Batillaria attramentaria TaxID=370345 RepID=A0ABD0LBV9_9CAEN
MTTIRPTVRYDREFCSWQNQIGPDGLRLAVIYYWSNATVHFSFGSCLSDVGACIASIPYVGGGTETYLALEMARTQLFNTARPDVRKIAVLMTDGKSGNTIKTTTEGHLLKNSGVDVVAIGIGSGVNYAELDAVASAKPYVFSVTFGSLDEIRTTFRGLLCWLGSQPDLNTCRMKVVGQGGTEETASLVPEGMSTHCTNQKDASTNVQPVSLIFDVKANVSISTDNLPYYKNAYFDAVLGVTGASLSLDKVSVRGSKQPYPVRPLNGAPYCSTRGSNSNPVRGGTLHQCSGTIALSPLRLTDGERLCVTLSADAGGYFTNKSSGARSYFPSFVQSKQICFLYDESKPAHCLGGCSSEPLQLSSRLVRSPEIGLLVNGWADSSPAPLRHALSASGIKLYKAEVHRVLVGSDSLLVEDAALESYTQQWDADGSQSGGPYNVSVMLPEEGAARLYAVILEVHDKAGNVAYARRLVLYDNTSSVQLNASASVSLASAESGSRRRRQVNMTDTHFCLNWTGRFYNSELDQNNFLLPVTPDTGRQIHGDYDQQSGLLPVTGTDNVKGIVSFQEVADIRVEGTCLSEQLYHNETYRVWIRATDIMGNYKDDSVRLGIDVQGNVVLMPKGRKDDDSTSNGGVPPDAVVGGVVLLAVVATIVIVVIAIRRRRNPADAKGPSRIEEPGLDNGGSKVDGENELHENVSAGNDYCAFTNPAFATTESKSH